MRERAARNVTLQEALELEAGDQVIYKGKHVGAVESFNMLGGMSVNVKWPGKDRLGLVHIEDLERA